MDDNRCPVTGLPCPHPKVIHVTDCNSKYECTGVFHLCQICGNQLVNKAIQQASPKPAPPPPQQPQGQSVLPPIVKGFLDLLALAMANKMQGMAALPVQQQYIPQQPVLPKKPPCPECGTTLQDIATTSRLGCAHCYEHFREELLPVFIHAHKATEHVGKRPKKGPEVPLDEQVRLLELQLKQAIDQEQYERAKEIKDQLDKLKHD
jgi:protein-arginine kinase activator protein McsA